jgi:ABC-type antimicrobial peptide transport system permease subunit
MHYLTEAVIVGFMTLVVGLAVSWAFSQTSSTKEKLPKGSIPKMALALFITGFLIHVLCEQTGINRMYCESKQTPEPANTFYR